MLIISNRSIAETYQGVAFGGGWQNAWRVALSLCCCFGDSFSWPWTTAPGWALRSLPPFPPPPMGDSRDRYVIYSINRPGGEEERKVLLGGGGQCSAILFLFLRWLQLTELAGPFDLYYSAKIWGTFRISALSALERE